MSKLIIFDLDGTITTETQFYKEVYSGTLNKLIADEKGDEGKKMLDYCRKNYDGKGELALFALNIPFKKWARLLINAPLDLLGQKDDIVNQIRGIEAKKVIYTGSPVKMAVRMLDHIGFSKDDFDSIVGWDEPEFFPVKWSCSPLMFEKIIQSFKINFREIWSVGDNWETDLEPAKKMGIKTAMVRKNTGSPDVVHLILEDFIKSIMK